MSPGLLSLALGLFWLALGALFWKLHYVDGAVSAQNGPLFVAAAFAIAFWNLIRWRYARRRARAASEFRQQLLARRPADPPPVTDPGLDFTRPS